MKVFPSSQENPILEFRVCEFFFLFLCFFLQLVYSTFCIELELLLCVCIYVNNMKYFIKCSVFISMSTTITTQHTKKKLRKLGEQKRISLNAKQ